MQFTNSNAEIFVPDGIPVADALKRTTHLAISAHQDDLEIMSFGGILECFGSDSKWYTGVVVTDGAGSPRDDLYANYTDEDMKGVRRLEQKKAAYVGEYAAQALLMHTSAAVKDPSNPTVVSDIRQILDATRPSAVFIHNLADKHDTHVAVSLRAISAMRDMPIDQRPDFVYGCEVWRDLDWMMDDDKVGFDVSAHENLAAALLGVFDSQICGGKRYDLATVGRRRAHATYYASHGTDTTTQTAFAMDLTPLIKDASLDITEFVESHIKRFADDVTARLSKAMG